MSNDFDSIRDSLTELLASSRFIQQQAICHVHLLINPAAGRFTQKNQLEAMQALLKSSGAGVKIPCQPVPVRLHISPGPGELGRIAQDIAQSSHQGHQIENILFVILGGDGTHHEVLSALTVLPPIVLEKMWVFRFPAGTGNDSADAWTQDQALWALTESVNTGKLGAVRVSTARGASYYSFNIASLGIDAYVVHLNNIFQHVLPGNFYRLFSDIGVLFYGLIHGYRLMDIRRQYLDGPWERETRKNAIMVLGVSGFRTYGNEKWVLPDERNYCSILKGNLIKNLRFKKKLFQARHPELASCTMGSVTRLEIQYPGNILMQLDGEVKKLEAADFPVLMETVSTNINYMSAKEISTQSVPLHSKRDKPDNQSIKS